MKGPGFDNFGAEFPVKDLDRVVDPAISNGVGDRHNSIGDDSKIGVG